MEGLERIKVLASEITHKATLNVINYLLSREDMNDKYLNEEKSLKQMIDFIRSEARKQAQDGMAMIEDSTVYGWAIHYFDESNEDLGLTPKKQQPAKEEASEEVEEDVVEDKMQNQTIDEMIKEEIKEEQQEEVKQNTGNIIKPKWVAEGQLSIFDL